MKRYAIQHATLCGPSWPTIDGVVKLYSNNIKAQQALREDLADFFEAAADKLRGGDYKTLPLEDVQQQARQALADVSGNLDECSVVEVNWDPETNTFAFLDQTYNRKGQRLL